MAGRRPAARERGRAVVVTTLATVLLGAASCLGSVDRIYSDGGAGPGNVDATVDAVAFDVLAAEGSDGGGGSQDVTSAETSTPESGGPVDAATDAEAGGGQVYMCNGQPVTSCGSCGNSTVECVFCGPGGSHPGVCGPKGMYCTSSAPPGASVCECPGNNLASCVAPFQACVMIGATDYCQTCGEMGSDGRPCKGGGTCNAATGTCS
jgi:hypothetical protein